MQLIDPKKYTEVTDHLRSFFFEKNFLEVHTQNRLSILAACEDPSTVSTFAYAGQVWPLPQTGQMWLEYELLNKPNTDGFFCISTSYRQEPLPIPGRHDLIFPMFEFEMPGHIEDLRQLEIELCDYLNFSKPVIKDYLDWGEEFGTRELTHHHEELMYDKYGVAFIQNFPNWTSPFWNMKQNGNGTAAKIDVILGGMETIGSAERSADPKEMREQFHTISDGLYKGLLYSHFGKERVEHELEQFLAYDFFPRCGGGIGLTRLINALSK
jgi:aspartyl/asparaginyl-tRNA synthetase